MAQFILSAFADEAADSLEGQIAALKRNGIRCIEPRNVGGNLITKTDEELEQIAAQLKEAGISVSALGSPIGKFNIDDDFDVHLADYRRALRVCEILGATRMRMFSFFVPQERLAECREEVMRRMKILLEMAKEAGVTLCHENESHIYGQNPKEVRDLLTSLPGLKGVFDASNFIMHDQDPIEGIEATLLSFEYLHVKDCIAGEKAIVPCGMGSGRYDEVLRRVDAATDGLVYVTLEPHLHIFEAYARIDSKTLKTGLEFEDAGTAFDFAVKKLKELLVSLGYEEGEDKIWRK